MDTGYRCASPIAHVVLLLIGLSFYSATTDAQVLGNPAAQPVEPNARLRHPFADPELWRIDGVEAFSISQMKGAVSNSIEFLRASYPNTKDADLLNAIRSAVLRGYHNRGYANVRVAADIDRTKNRVWIQVKEGPTDERGAKFVAGDVIVTGVKRLSAERLIHWCKHIRPIEPRDIVIRTNAKSEVTQKRNQQGRVVEPEGEQLKKNPELAVKEPLWETGSTKSMLAEQQQHVKEFIGQAFEDQGFYHVGYDFVVVADQPSRTLQLKINIKKEGPLAKIGRLEVAGQAFNSRAAILSYLKLSEGQPISGHRCAQIKQKLFQAGRFLRHSAMVVAGQPDQAEIALYIDVREFNDAPTLAQEMSPIQTASIDLANWVSAWPKSDSDLVIEVKVSAKLRETIKAENPFPIVDHLTAGTIRLIVSPKGGCILQIQPENATGSSQETLQLLLSAEGMIRIQGHETDVVEFTGDHDSSFFVTCVLKGVPKNPPDHKASMSFGLNLMPIKRGHVFSFAPATAVEGLTRVEELDLHETPTELQMITKNSEIVFDRKSRQPKLMRALLGTEESGVAELLVTPKVGAFTEAVEKIQRLVKHRGAVTRKASTSEVFRLAGGLIGDWMKMHDGKFSKQNRGWMLRLCDATIWQPLFDQIAGNDFPDMFTVPNRDEVGSRFGKKLLYRLVHQSIQSKETQTLGQIAGMIVPMLTQSITLESPVFAFGSAPWAINRQLSLKAVSGSEQRYMEVLLTDDNQIGPLACVYEMALTQSELERKRLAIVGLEVIDKFELDRAWLLDKNSLTRPVLETTANAFSRLAPSDVKRFLNSLTGAKLSDASVARILEPLDPDRNLNDRMLAQFTTALWANWFQPALESTLQSVAWPQDKYLANLLRRADRRKQINHKPAALRDFNQALRIFDQIVKANDGKPSDLWVAKFRGAMHFAIAKTYGHNGSATDRMLGLASIRQSIAAYEAALSGFQFTQLSKDERNAMRQLSETYEGRAYFHFADDKPAAGVASLAKSVDIYKRTTAEALDSSEKTQLARRLNRHAWELATSSSAAVRDGKKAVKLATRVNELTGVDATAMATLAAALATQGEFGRAIRLQKMAIEQCNVIERGPFQERLNLYNRRIPFHQPPTRVAERFNRFK